MIHVSVALINLLSVILIMSLLELKIKKHSLRNYTHEMSSFKPRLEILKRIEVRFLKQTQLDSILSIDQFGQLYSIWCAVCTVLLLLFQFNAPILLVLMLVFYGFPFMVLEKYLSFVDLKIDQGIFELLSHVNARLIKNEDVIAALKESQSTLKNKYVLHIVNQFNQYIKIGIPPGQVFSIIQTSIHNDYLKYLFINVEIVFKRRGSITELMKALENEFTSIQIEVNKRKVEIEYEKNMMLFSIFLVAITVIRIISDHDYISSYFSQNTQMVYPIVFIIIIGLAIAFSANKTSY